MTDNNRLADDEIEEFDAAWERKQKRDELHARRNPVFARELEIYEQFVSEGLVLLTTDGVHYRALARKLARAEFVNATIEFPPPGPGPLARLLRRLRGA